MRAPRTPRNEGPTYVAPPLIPLRHWLMKPMRKLLLLGTFSGIVSGLALFVAQGKYFSVFRHEDRGIRAADRQFLDEILLSENDVHLLGRSPLAADANTEKTAMIASGDGPAPRAELVVNSGTVKRAELVERGGRVKRAELARPGRQ